MTLEKTSFQNNASSLASFHKSVIMVSGYPPSQKLSKCIHLLNLDERGFINIWKYAFI